MKLCPLCGSAVNENEAFCSSCGSPVDAVRESYAEREQQEPQSADAATDPIAQAVPQPPQQPPVPEQPVESAQPQQPYTQPQQQIPPQGYVQQPPYAPTYGQQPYAPPVYAPYPVNETVRVGEWVLNLFLCVIPIVNIIMLFVWGFGQSTKPSQRNWARAMLIFFGIGIALWFVVMVLGAVAFSNLMYYY